MPTAIVVSVGDKRPPAPPQSVGMNRIREIREAAGLTQDELAEKANTSQNTIYRLESGRMQLTQEWMERIARVLFCSPKDLIENIALTELRDDVEELPTDAVTAAIAKRGIRVYRVTSNSVVGAGIKIGDVVTIDSSEASIAGVQGLDIVLATIGASGAKVLRQFVPPNILLSNQDVQSLAVSINDKSLSPTIIGVVLRG